MQKTLLDVNFTDFRYILGILKPVFIVKYNVLNVVQQQNPITCQNLKNKTNIER